MLKGFLSFIWELLKIVVLAAIIVVPIRYFVFQPFVVRGISMEPTFHDGDYLIVDEISYRFRQPKRGEIIVFHYPKNPSERFIKRIIGLPGEEVKIEGKIITIINNQGKHILDESSYLGQGYLFEGNEDVKLNKDQYFVAGDNRLHSFDSRMWGPVNKKYIIGRVLLRIFPIGNFTSFPLPNYGDI